VTLSQFILAPLSSGPLLLVQRGATLLCHALVLLYLLLDLL
jgi:hypothetical protein